MGISSLFYRGVRVLCRPFIKIEKKASEKLDLLARNACRLACDKTFSSVNEWDGFFSNTRLITHAGGGLQGMVYLNAEEAFSVYYQHGNRVFEYDVDCDECGEYVFSHREKGEADEEYIAKRYVPLTLKKCLELLEQYKDVTVLFDCKFQTRKEFAEYLLQNVEDNDARSRIVIQIFNEENAREVQSVYPFKMLHVCMYGANYVKTLETCLKYQIGAVSISHKALQEREGWQIFPKHNVCIFAYTVNSLKEYACLRRQAVQGVFSDFLYESDLKLIEEVHENHQ